MPGALRVFAALCRGSDSWLTPARFGCLSGDGDAPRGRQCARARAATGKSATPAESSHSPSGGHARSSILQKAVAFRATCALHPIAASARWPSSSAASWRTPGSRTRGSGRHRSAPRARRRGSPSPADPDGAGRAVRLRRHARAVSAARGRGVAAPVSRHAARAPAAVRRVRVDSDRRAGRLLLGRRRGGIVARGAEDVSPGGLGRRHRRRLAGARAGAGVHGADALGARRRRAWRPRSARCASASRSTRW